MKSKAKKELNFLSLFANNQLLSIVKKYRRILNIPSEGFENLESKKKWLTQNNYLKNQSYSNFKIEIQKILTPFNFKNEDKLFLWFLLSRDLDWDTFQLNNWFENFSVIFVRKNNTNLTSGIYIKISPFANLTGIRSFISSNHEQISEYQYLLKNKIDPKQKSKYSINSTDVAGRRDFMIYTMSLLTPKQLIDCWNLSDIYEYKEQLISRAIALEGFKVSIDNIKKIISRMGKKLYP